MTITATATTTTTAAPSAPRRMRRSMAAALAGAALFASTAVIGNRIADDHSPGAISAQQSSTADLTQINGAIHVSTAPDATPLMGLGDIVRGFLPGPTGLVGVEDVVRGSLIELPN